MAKVLLLDEELTLVQMVGELLRSEGHQVVPVTSGPAALDRLSTIGPELVIANVTAAKSRSSALGVLQKSRTLNPPALVLVITGADSIGSASETFRRGAYDYLAKPFTLDELKLRVQRALSYHATLSENAALRKQLHSKPQFPEIIGASPKLQEALRLMERAAESDSCTLICGQNGTGKELVARAVHFKSRRNCAPFIVVNCSGLPENLLELELFGQRKVAGNEEQPGLFREADGGTVFLDDIDALSSSLQNRLVDVLRDRQIRHPGDLLAHQIDVRILAAARDTLERKVESGAFLRALFLVLSEISILLPPLRERQEDIPLLIAHFLATRIRLRTGKEHSLSPEALEACRTYPWPGNIRELEHALEQAASRARNGTIQPEDFPQSIQHLKPSPKLISAMEAQSLQRDRAECANIGRFTELGRATDCPSLELATGLVPLKQYLRIQEITYLQRTLAQVGGSKERAAELLGISLATMYRKLSEPNGTSEHECS